MTPTINLPLRIGYACACAGAAVPYSVSGAGSANTFEIVISAGFALVVAGLIVAGLMPGILDELALLAAGLFATAAVYTLLEADTGTAEKWSLGLTYAGLALIGYAAWLTLHRRADG